MVYGVSGMKKTLFVSFSGGRTLAYMCWWLLDNKADEYDLRFVFANTGLEHENTLDFVDRCDREWGLNLTWVEAVTSMEHGVGVTHKVVNYETAARNGEPFEQFIRFAGIPNAAYNQCSERLKAMPMEHYRQSQGFTRKHPTAIGIRADEIDRMSPTAKENGLVYPLILWTQTTKAEIRHWWAQQPFDLDLPEHLGNCVTCWKKSDRKLLTIAKHEPERFAFMDRMEREHSHLKAEVTCPKCSGTGLRLVGYGAGSESAKCLMCKGRGTVTQPRVFFRRHRTAREVLAEAQKPFKEFVDHMPELQMGMFDPIDLEDDCGSGCEIQ